MRFSQALLLAPWVSVKQFYYYRLIEIANYMGIPVVWEEDEYDLGIGEEASVPSVSNKSFLWLNHSEQEQPVIHLRVNNHTLSMDFWPEELWDLESLDLDQYPNNITLDELITAHILIALTWLMF